MRPKYNTIFRVPTLTGKPGKMGRHFPVREKSGNFEQTGKSGKITQNTGKLREFEINIMIFLVIFKLTVYYLPKWIKFSVKKKQNIKKVLEKWQRVLEKSGNFVSLKKWEP